jgi:tRNA A37 methylthiotransferase MiaB
MKERSRILRDLGFKKKNEFYRSFIGRSFPVLVERGSKGTTPNYMNVRILSSCLNIGDEIEVEIRNVNREEALGVPLSQPIQ